MSVHPGLRGAGRAPGGAPGRSAACPPPAAAPVRARCRRSRSPPRPRRRDAAACPAAIPRRPSGSRPSRPRAPGRRDASAQAATSGRAGPSRQRQALRAGRHQALPPATAAAHRQRHRQVVGQFVGHDHAPDRPGDGPRAARPPRPRARRGAATPGPPATPPAPRAAPPPEGHRAATAAGTRNRPRHPPRSTGSAPMRPASASAKRARVAPKRGLTSGLVRKSPSRAERSGPGGEVALVGVVQGGLHELVEGERALLPDPVDETVAQHPRQATAAPGPAPPRRRRPASAGRSRRPAPRRR